jgi:recombination protein RecR
VDVGMVYTKPLARLIEEFQKLPGIGPKSAQRLAFHVLKRPDAEIHGFSEALLDAKAQIDSCHICYNLSCENPCEICTNPNRDRMVLCVVGEVRDLFALERTGEFRGVYHVLEGLISPLEGVGPQDLRIQDLLDRLANTPEINEVILALPPSVEGDTTSLYLARMLKSTGIKLTRIAFGLPVGGDLEYADALTLTRALAGRSAV